MEDTTCLLIGGAKHADFFWGRQREKQYRMIQSVQHDFQNVIEYAADRAFNKRTRRGTQVSVMMQKSFLVTITNVCYLYPLESCKELSLEWSGRLQSNANPISFSEATSNQPVPIKLTLKLME